MCVMPILDFRILDVSDYIPQYNVDWFFFLDCLIIGSYRRHP
jgi:3'-phosphoadenosine 5'-phosphosulfate sulfotransferase (PAPS reductase)/FAD synthetase